MVAQIVMVIDENEYIYGTYPFNTDLEKNRVNEIALHVRNERQVDTFVKEV